MICKLENKYYSSISNCFIRLIRSKKSNRFIIRLKRLQIFVVDTDDGWYMTIDDAHQIDFYL